MTFDSLDMSSDQLESLCTLVGKKMGKRLVEHVNVACSDTTPKLEVMLRTDCDTDWKNTFPPLRNVLDGILSVILKGYEHISK